MKGFPLILFALTLCLGILPGDLYGKKVKNSFKIEKERRSKGEEKMQGKDFQFEGTRVSLMADSIPEGEMEESFPGSEATILRNVAFAGYDKEVNSRRESFHVVNPSEFTLSGFKVKIDYLDMQGRMLHSRTILEECFIPPGESRRMDIKSWDTQNTYYYYLGNEPKRVATPFQVKFTPLEFWILKGE